MEGKKMGLNLRRKFSDDDKIKILQEGSINGVPQTLRKYDILTLPLDMIIFINIFPDSLKKQLCIFQLLFSFGS